MRNTRHPLTIGDGFRVGCGVFLFLVVINVVIAVLWFVVMGQAA